MLTPEARKRLQTVEEFSDLGSSFNIAMRDMDIRGAGNLLGAEQSGFITDIGYKTYQKILAEAMQELKEGEYKELFEDEIGKHHLSEMFRWTLMSKCTSRTSMLAASTNASGYMELHKVESEEGIEEFASKLTDRFDPIPPLVNELFEGLRIRWICKELGFDRVVLSDKLRLFFLQNPQSAFYERPFFSQFLGFVASNGQEHGLTLKQSRTNLIVIKDNVHSLKKAYQALHQLKGTLYANISETESETA